MTTLRPGKPGRNQIRLRELIRLARQRRRLIAAGIALLEDLAACPLTKQATESAAALDHAITSAVLIDGD